MASAAGAFDLSVADVEVVAAEVAQGRRLWSACRRRPRADVGNLARVRIPRAGWDDLVLPEPQLEQLRALVAAVRHRSTVLEDWGFAARTSRGLGTAALFAGASGTGKTFAAEVIAHELELDLVHVDLSQVVDKYLGETEKRLSRLFDAAENGGMVLLFDEADALFGKRSEVKDSHDRYANVEVGYLLQRLESFAGLAVLTTNARSALDQAFTRRLSAIVTFPYPDRAARLRMWSQALPAALPRADARPRAPLRGRPLGRRHRVGRAPGRLPRRRRRRRAHDGPADPRRALGARQDRPCRRERTARDPRRQEHIERLRPRPSTGPRGMPPPTSCRKPAGRHTPVVRRGSSNASRTQSTASGAAAASRDSAERGVGQLLDWRNWAALYGMPLP